MKKKLTIADLIKEAKYFCRTNSGVYSQDLFGITDGKAVGTYVERKFKEFLSVKYDLEQGNAASGLDLPTVNTDIKVTSIKQPQSSCPFKNSKQKIYGLGYNLLVFIYQKHDDTSIKEGMLEFLSCSFIDKGRTGDYQTTTGIWNIISNNGNADDVYAFLSEHHIPADEVELYEMAEELLANPPAIGYLTISNALQWRLQYGRIVAMKENVEGITSIVRYNAE